MKTKYVIILIVAVIAVAGAAGWLAKGYYVEKERADFITSIVPDTVTVQVLVPVEVEPVTIKEIVYKERFTTFHDTIIRVDTVTIESNQFKSTFEYSPKEFNMTVIGWADSPIDSIQTAYKMKQAYINEIMRASHTVTTEYPWYGKAFWVGTGILVGYMGNEWYRTLKHNRTL